MTRTSRANYMIVEDKPGHPLVIRDIGPWAHYLTITNDAESVVEELFQSARLPHARRLFYFDSDGDLDEIVIRDGKFAGFHPLNNADREEFKL